MPPSPHSHSVRLAYDFLTIAAAILFIVAFLTRTTTGPGNASEWGDLLAGASSVVMALSLVLVAASFRQQQDLIGLQRQEIADNLVELQEGRRLAEARRLEDSFLSLMATMNRVSGETTFQGDGVTLTGVPAFQAYAGSYLGFLRNHPAYARTPADGFAHWFRQHEAANESIEPFIRAVIATLRHVKAMEARQCRIGQTDHACFSASEIDLWKDLLIGSLTQDQIKLLLVFGASRFATSDVPGLFREARMIERLRGKNKEDLGVIATAYA